MKKRIELVLSILLIACSVCQSSIIPLQAGTLFVEDKFLRLNTCTFKNIDLQLTKETLQTTPNVQAIAAIRHLKINDQITFQIFYSIECPQMHCQIAFTIQRLSSNVSEFFNYELTIDFLIAANMKVMSVNMTNHRQTFTLDEKQEQYQLSQVLVKEKLQQGRLVAILIPNGFNDISLTGSVTITSLPSSDVFVLQYNQPTLNSHQWTMNKYFIYYKVVLVPLNYLETIQKTVHIAFGGFQATTKKEINTPASPSNNYKTFEIPLEYDQYFVDRRITEEFSANLLATQVRQSSTNYFVSRFVLGIVLVVLLEMSYLAYRARIKNRVAQKKKGIQVKDQSPQSFVSEPGGKNNTVLQSTVAVSHESEGQIKRNCLGQ